MEVPLPTLRERVFGPRFEAPPGTPKDERLQHSRMLEGLIGAFHSHYISRNLASAPPPMQHAGARLREFFCLRCFCAPLRRP